jgi:hypothetical protein
LQLSKKDEESGEFEDVEETSGEIASYTVASALVPEKILLMKEKKPAWAGDGKEKEKKTGNKTTTNHLVYVAINKVFLDPPELQTEIGWSFL